MSKKTKVVLVKPGEKAVITEINSSLSSMQEIVGGTIQALYPYQDNVALVCNDDGKILRLPLNRALRSADSESNEIYDIICGNFIVVGCGKEDFQSLTDEQAILYRNKFIFPEKFARIDEKIVVVPYEYL